MRALIAAAVIVSTLGAACGSDECTPGSESCICTTSGLCQPGLTCLSNHCVQVPGAEDDATPMNDAGASDTPAQPDTPDAVAAPDVATEPVEPVVRTPGFIAPTEPGSLVVSPLALVLEPGNEVAASVTLHLGDGTSSSPASLVWSSEAASVASVNATGLIRAETPGVTRVAVTDGSHGFAWISVSVTSDAAEVPAGAVSADLGSPAIALLVGEETPLSAVLKDASGQVVPGAVELVPSVAGVIEVVDEVVRALAPGVVELEAFQGTTPLSGGVTVTVSDPAELGIAPGSTPAQGACDDWVVKSCGFVSQPLRFTRPGVSAELRVAVTRVRNCDGAVMVQQQSPDEVTIYGDEVIDVGGSGQLAAKAPGIAAIFARVEGVECNPCKWGVVVQPDLRGTWDVSCDNGDKGSLEFQTINADVLYTGDYHFAYKGSGEFCAGDEGSFFCEDDAISATPVVPLANACARDYNPGSGTWTLRHPGEIGPCTEDAPCRGPRISHCASDRHHVCPCNGEAPGGWTRGPDELVIKDSGGAKLADCEVTRGAGGVCAPSDPCECEPLHEGELGGFTFRYCRAGELVHKCVKMTGAPVPYTVTSTLTYPAQALEFAPTSESLWTTDLCDELALSGYTQWTHVDAAGELAEACDTLGTGCYYAWAEGAGWDPGYDYHSRICCPGGEYEECCPTDQCDKAPSPDIALCSSWPTMRVACQTYEAVPFCQAGECPEGRTCFAEADSDPPFDKGVCLPEW